MAVRPQPPQPQTLQNDPTIMSTTQIQRKLEDIAGQLRGRIMPSTARNDVRDKLNILLTTVHATHSTEDNTEQYEISDYQEHIPIEHTKDFLEKEKIYCMNENIKFEEARKQVLDKREEFLVQYKNK